MLRLYAHRGASDEAPENTLLAFSRALELGATALETDVHATRDGVVIVSHDPDGARAAGVGRAFQEVSFREVRSWDAGYGFVAPDGGRPFAGRGLTIPSLEELIEAFPGVPLNIDLKAPIAELVVPLIRRMGAEDRICLASFSLRTQMRVRALGYRGQTSLAQADALSFLALPAPLQRGPLRPGASRAQLPVSLARPWVVARARALGLGVDYWTVNDEGTARRLAALGVDGIMTDSPRRIAPVLSGLLG